MKLKKLSCIFAAVVLLFSAVNVSAAINVPKPKDNADAYRLAETFYHDGYYYEARAELLYVNTNDFYYDANKQAAWMDKVDYKINRLAIKNIIAEAKQLNSELKFAEGLIALEKANSYDITEDEYYLLVWWENALIKNLNSPKYQNKAVSTAAINSGVKAIEAVKKDYTINSKYEWYSPVKVEDGYHVYIKTRTPSGVSENVAAFRVSSEGAVQKVF